MITGLENSWQEGEGDYRAFLLRCWQEEDPENGGEPGESFCWRFALVQLNGGSSKKGFACLEELVVYLRDQLSRAGELAEKPSGIPVHRPKNSTDEISE